MNITGTQGEMLCAVCVTGDCVIVRALDRVEELLPKRAIDAPIGSVVVEMRRFVRLMGEGVLRARRRVSLCGGVGMGNLVGNLALWRLLQSELRLVVSESFLSCLTMSSMESALGG